MGKRGRSARHQRKREAMITKMGQALIEKMRQEDRERALDSGLLIPPDTPLWRRPA